MGDKKNRKYTRAAAHRISGKYDSFTLTEPSQGPSELGNISVFILQRMLKLTGYITLPKIS